MSNLRSKLVYLLFLFLCGCSMLLRYNFEEAINNLPPNCKISQVNNDYILYSITNNTFKAYYSVDGKIYKTTHVKN